MDLAGTSISPITEQKKCNNDHEDGATTPPLDATSVARDNFRHQHRFVVTE